MMGGVTGFTAAVNAYAVGGFRGLLVAASVICIAAMWYYVGRNEGTEHEIETLEQLTSAFNKDADA